MKKSNLKTLSSAGTQSGPGEDNLTPAETSGVKQSAPGGDNITLAETSGMKQTAPGADNLTLAERVMAPTPKFFRMLRTIGVVIGLVGGAILASPVALPVAIVTVGGYLTLAGTIMTGVSQTAVAKE